MKSLSLIVIAFFVGSIAMAQKENDGLTGAWKYENGDTVTALIITARNFSEAVYNPKSKEFYYTTGGSWSMQNGHFLKQYEFSSAHPELVGKTQSYYLQHETKGKFSVINETTQQKKEFVRLDNGQPGKLAGAWLITARKNGGDTQTIIPGARRTMKILSGTRFQWIAFNSETKEFFGTGGGTYTSENGKYVENLEFFSRDNSRVGSSLTFEFELDDHQNWRHKGFSSKGDPIDEVWTKMERIKL